ncbi:hypothetical protein [Gracilibacillus oryzae]|nr:hypothetical protein [Gracilibacillus oryzae]
MDTGTTARAECMLKPGEIKNRMGKAVFGAAGSIAGSPMGSRCYDIYFL